MTAAETAYKTAETKFSEAEDNYNSVKGKENEYNLALKKAQDEQKTAQKTYDIYAEANKIYSIIYNYYKDFDQTAESLSNTDQNRIDNAIKEATDYQTTLAAEEKEALSAWKSANIAVENFRNNHTSTLTDEDQVKYDELLEAQTAAENYYKAIHESKEYVIDGFISDLSKSTAIDDYNAKSQTERKDLCEKNDKESDLTTAKEATEAAQKNVDNIKTYTDAYNTAKKAKDDALATWTDAKKAYSAAETAAATAESELSYVKDNKYDLVSGKVEASEAKTPNLYKLTTAIEKATAEETKAYKAYDIAQDEYQTARAKYYASKLSKPVIKVKAGKKCVKVTWKKVTNATKYKVRVKKGNGKYKSYYTTKTSFKVKAKKGTKVKVCVRAQNGSNVSKYSTKKAARAK